MLAAVPTTAAAQRTVQPYGGLAVLVKNVVSYSCTKCSAIANEMQASGESINNWPISERSAQDGPRQQHSIEAPPGGP